MSEDRADQGDVPAPGHVNADLDLDALFGAERALRKAAAAGSGRGRRQKSMKITCLKVAAWSMAGVLVASGGIAMYLYERFFSQIDTVSLNGLKHRPAPAKSDPEGNTPLNLLVLGSQTRDGQHGVNLGNSTKLGTDLSDTTMFVHINAERHWAVVVSIPRDLLEPRPDCPARNDPSQIYPGAAMDPFYYAMNFGGPACAVATFEQMSGIRVDHFVEMTFNAFQDLTNAVGGVPVCIPEPGIDDPDYSGLVLSAGLHTVTGTQALEFVRDRHGLASGMDTARIQMQQMFVTSLFNKVTSAGTLADPVELLRIANAVTSNLTVDDGLKSLGALVDLAESAGQIKSHYLQFVTTPYVVDPPGTAYDPAGVHLSEGSGFDALWAYLRNDEPLPGSNAAATYPATATATATAGTHASDGSDTGAANPRPSGADVDVRAPGAAPAAGPDAAPTPTPTINTESRTGDEDLCSDLPSGQYGGHP